MMWKRAVRALICSIGFVVVPLGVQAVPVVIDFESVADSDAITNQFSGLSFSHATALTAGVSLNEFEFPPRSGTNVILDNSGALTINFATAVTSVGGYFTYLNPLEFKAFDAGSNLVASDATAFSSNLALSGDAGSATNEFLSVAFAGGISRIVISGNPGGSSFVMDDLTFERGAVINTPEPGTLWLLLVSLIWVTAIIRSKSTCRTLKKVARRITE